MGIKKWLVVVRMKKVWEKGDRDGNEKGEAWDTLSLSTLSNTPIKQRNPFVSAPYLQRLQLDII
jgi:hypothetical protein